jgi:hypothetical protein
MNKYTALNREVAVLQGHKDVRTMPDGYLIVDLKGTGLRGRYDAVTDPLIWTHILARVGMDWRILGNQVSVDNPVGKGRIVYEGETLGHAVCMAYADTGGRHVECG